MRCTLCTRHLVLIRHNTVQDGEERRIPGRVTSGQVSGVKNQSNISNIRINGGDPWMNK